MDTCTHTPSSEFCAQLTACLPRMRSFARFLCRREDLADDLVQDTVVRALTAAHQFQPGSNFKAWIFTIMHNQNISNFRRKRPQIASAEVDSPSSCQIAPNQIDALVLRDLDSAMRRLAPAQREALVLVVVNGLSYEDAAQVCDCAIGTIKSRVARARTALHDMLMGREDESAVEEARREAASPMDEERSEVSSFQETLSSCAPSAS
jgi:RNA polymerase sigma-70 factor (ECF subfamily)